MNGIGTNLTSMTFGTSGASSAVATAMAQGGAQLESLVMGGGMQSGTLQLLKPFKTMARAAESNPEAAEGGSGFGKAALIAVGVAAGVGVGALLGGPIGLLMAGMASAMGVMSGFVSMQSENKKLRQENVKLREQATTDSLTGLANRGAIFERLEREGRRTLVDGKTMGVIMADVDFFKKVNDNYGHAAGDAVLKEVAKRMQENVRPGDTVGRYGGEELMVVLPDCDAAGLYQTAERLRAAVESSPIPTISGAIRVTMSLGVAVTERMKETSTALLVAAADEALYRAKRGGRNRVECAFRR